MWFSLRAKMIAAMATLLIFIIALFGILQVRMATSALDLEVGRLRALHTEHAVTIGLRTASSIAAGSHFLIADNNFGALQDKLGPALAEARSSALPITQAMIVDPAGAVLAYADADPKAASPGRLDVGDLEGLKGARAAIEEDEGVPARVLATAPIIDRNDKLWGYARFVLDLEGLRADLSSVERNAGERRAAILERAAFIGALVVLLGVVITVLQALAITRPMVELARSARRIAEGDIDARVPERGRDEIGEMARNFNDMAGRLRGLLIDTAAMTAFERELEVARIIQETLLPPRGLVLIGGMELSGFLESASLCGGDFWSFLDLGDGRVLFCVGDVTGHGVPGAMITAACKSGLDTLNSVTRGQFKVAYLLDELNRTIHAAAQRKFTMTFFAAIVDRRTGQMEMANAGHNFPILVRRAAVRPGEAAEVTSRALVCRGNRLGDQRDSRYSPLEAPLVPGDLICLYTDGVTEYRNEDGHMFGERRLRRLLHDHIDGSPEAIIDAIVHDLRAFAGPSVQEDDITLVIARYGGEPRASA